MSFSPFHIIIILVLGVLLFGKNLPAMAKQIGSALMEFRKGMDDWKEVHAERKSGGHKSTDTTVAQDKSAEHFESLGAKFEPPSEST